eukprot:TRINITY_DN3230_c0_g1_i1.p1 TRINITY_DN3230_c0_g1~~TRINITY_DN3230_c0_g1_i1.p1  ORF type:complete len:280 (-),score=51.78 TRINITY_DN3230_c0_g1_i1:129-968(-)
MEDGNAIHRPYEKMSESTSKWDFQSSTNPKAFTTAKSRGSAKLNPSSAWCVTEKVDGANLCFISDGKSVQIAKRRELLTEDDTFFGYRSVLQRYRQSVLQLFNLVHDRNSKISSISVYGELFGGAYPTKDGDIEENDEEPVQTGILYCPHKEFYAFDIAIEEPNQLRDYLDFDVALELFQQAGLFAAVPLFVGTFEACLHYNNQFPTTIPARLGLHKIDLSNLAEGVVIKPMKTTYIGNGKSRTRAIVKNKIEKFAEKMISQNLSQKGRSEGTRLNSSH